MSVPVKYAERFTEAEIDDEIVIMRLDTGEFFSLSQTGAAIWRLIDGARSRDALVAILAGGFAADKSVVDDDVRAFLFRLEKAGLAGHR